MKQSTWFRKDYDYGFLDDRTIGIVRPEKENPIVTVLAFLGIVALIALAVIIL